MRTLNLLEGLEKVGQLSITGEVVITDPCYDLDTWCIAKTELPHGMYDCFKKEKEGTVSEMWILKENTADVFLEIGEELSQCGVDSGQLGIFNLSRFNEDVTDEDLEKSLLNEFPCREWERHFEEGETKEERFYKVCCNHTLNNARCGIVDEVGFISSSGYGDGSYYPDKVLDREGNVVGIRVVFIGDTEHEDE